jgi:hypothetical protein
MLERRAIWLLTLSVLVASTTSFAQTTRTASMGGEVISDFKYLTNTARRATRALADLIDERSRTRVRRCTRILVVGCRSLL